MLRAAKSHLRARSSVPIGSILIAVAVFALLLVFADSHAAASDTSTRWESFSESSGCGEPFTATPFASQEGGLPDGEPILGPFGTYFGRSISQVRASLVPWTVPGSGGRTVLVHRAMLPSLEQVRSGLAAEAAIGRTYQITSAGAFVPRSIRGSHRISRHALGLAIDLNPASNPQRSDGTLITDMPAWFVDVWRNAGFCWGGDWENSKDPMHFSWMGPRSAGLAGAFVGSLAPATSKTAFGGPTAVTTTPFGPVMALYEMNVTDGSGNGAPDVVGVRAHPEGSVIDIASSTRGYGVCSIFRWFVPDRSISQANHVLFGDVDGDSGQDLIALFTADGGVTATVATRRARFEDPTPQPSGLIGQPVSATAADFDGDHIADLWEGTSEGRLRIWKGPDWMEMIADNPLPGGSPVKIAAGDRDGGDTPELFALYDNGTGSQLQVLTFVGSWVLEDAVDLAESSAGVAALGAGDYDGDGRSDAQVLDGSGTLSVFLGNSPTGVAADRWFRRPDWECGGNEVLLDFDGVFFDDDDSIFQIHIESLARSGVTQGCNPPYKDRFCPLRPVTRAEMASFLTRGLGLSANNHPGFADVPSTSVFAQDIGRLATAGITKGCGDNLYCPNSRVTREQMAAFLVRALGLSENTHPGFIDVVPGSFFAEDIGRLATAGITKGCTASGDSFCPHGAVTREAMAGFLDRAAGLAGSP